MAILPLALSANQVIRTIRLGEYRYFRTSSGEERLFHLPSDPDEVRNLTAERPVVASTARARLDEWLLRTPEAPPQARPQGPGAKDIEALRALGYIH